MELIVSCVRSSRDTALMSHLPCWHGLSSKAAAFESSSLLVTSENSLVHPDRPEWNGIFPSVVHLSPIKGI